VDKNELERRTRLYAVRIIKFVAALPRGRVSDVLARQLLRSGTSIGANYREANRAESRPDFIHKIALVEKESAETHYWLSLMDEIEMGEKDERRWLLQESGELVAIFTKVVKSSKMRRIRTPNSEIRTGKDNP